MKPSELLEYKDDKSFLASKFFLRVGEIDNDVRSESEDERDVLDELINTKIEPYTLRHGENLLFHDFIIYIYYIFKF